MRQENFYCHVGWGQGWDKKKPCEAETKIPSFGPAQPHCHPYAKIENGNFEAWNGRYSHKYKYKLMTKLTYCTS